MEYIDKIRDSDMFNTLGYDDAQEETREIYDDISKHLGNEGLVDYSKVLGEYNINILRATRDLLKNVLMK